MPDPEPVLEVAAISYEEVEQQQRDRAEAKTTPTRRSRLAAKPKPRKAKPPRPHGRASQVDAAVARVGRGELGPQIVAEVTANMSTGMNASQAFADIAQKRGMKTGTVSANYYRVLRSHKDAPASKTRPTPSAKLAVAPARARLAKSGRVVAPDGAEQFDRILGDVVAAVEALADAISAQQVEVAEMRARLEQVRSALA